MKFMVAGLIVLLSSCGTKPVPQFQVTIDRPQLEPAPEWMTRQCPPLDKIPRKELSQSAAEQQWTKDMRMYHECRTKHAAFARWTKQRDEAFMKGLKK